MRLLIAVAAMLQAPATVPLEQTMVARPPADWATLPALRLLRRWRADPSFSRFVRSEVIAGRCAAAVREPRGWRVRVEMAVMAAPPGQIRRIVPRAIGCPTVEQYASGVVSRMARGNIDMADTETETWFRTDIDFAWAG